MTIYKKCVFSSNQQTAANSSCQSTITIPATSICYDDPCQNGGLCVAKNGNY